MSSTDERDGSTLETTRLAPADRDDIVVLSSADPRRPGRRDLIVGLVTVTLVIVAGLIAVVLMVRNGGNEKVHASPAGPVVTTPTGAGQPSAGGTEPKPTTTRAPSDTTPSTLAVVRDTTPPPTVANPVVPPPPISPPPAPTTVAPTKQYGASALTWSAPHSMTIIAGQTAVLAVAAHNHTDGTVTLPHPLSCSPRLDHGEMCPEVVQLLARGTSAGARYSIDATGVAPGHYTLRIEGVLSVAVTVRAAR